MISPQWRVHPDGSFDLQASELQLLDCYPAFDGASLRALSVEISHDDNAHRIEYRTVRGTLKLQLRVKRIARLCARRFRTRPTRRAGSVRFVAVW
jgi:hypothetical protein